MRKIQLAFLRFTVRVMVSSSLTLCNNSFFPPHKIDPNDLIHPCPAPHFKPVEALLISFPRNTYLHKALWREIYDVMSKHGNVIHKVKA